MPARHLPWKPVWDHRGGPAPSSTTCFLPQSGQFTMVASELAAFFPSFHKQIWRNVVFTGRHISPSLPRSQGQSFRPHQHIHISINTTAFLFFRDYQHFICFCSPIYLSSLFRHNEVFYVCWRPRHPCCIDDRLRTRVQPDRSILPQDFSSEQRKARWSVPLLLPRRREHSDSLRWHRRTPSQHADCSLLLQLHRRERCALGIRNSHLQPSLRRDG